MDTSHSFAHPSRHAAPDFDGSDTVSPSSHAAPIVSASSEDVVREEATVPAQEDDPHDASTVSWVFSRLYEVADDDVKLSAAYDCILRKLWTAEYWNAGTVGFCRILWSTGRQARSEDPRAFNSSGLYIWGVEERPLYIGMTTRTFRRRFRRYIWGTNSQCTTAKQFEGDPRVDGINGLPVELRMWYAKHLRNSHSRLRGALRFAFEGIDKIWFALVPYDDVAKIEYLERRLVPVAEKWNCDRGLDSLLNVAFTHRARRQSS